MGSVCDTCNRELTENDLQPIRVEDKVFCSPECCRQMNTVDNTNAITWQALAFLSAVIKEQGIENRSEISREIACRIMDIVEKAKLREINIYLMAGKYFVYSSFGSVFSEDD